jgi:hypothetical protein
VAAIIEYEVPDWEKLYWYLRYLIPDLHVDSTGEDIKDLLDAVDLNTYGLRRTALNETIVLDAGETTVEPNKPVMVNAGNNEEEGKDPLDVILEEFNKRWFKGWNATPEDQKAKFVNVVKTVANDKDYQEMVVGNPDQQAVDTAMAAIIDRAVRRMRQSDMSLYKSYQQNDGFKDGFRSVIIRMLDDALGVYGFQNQKLQNVEDDREVRNLIFNRLMMDVTISDYELQREVMEKFGERYPGTRLNDWRHIIEIYTPMVREASLSKAKEVSMRQYDKAAESSTEEYKE